MAPLVRVFRPVCLLNRRFNRFRRGSRSFRLLAAVQQRERRNHDTQSRDEASSRTQPLTSAVRRTHACILFLALFRGHFIDKSAAHRLAK